MTEPPQRLFELVARETVWSGAIVHVTRDIYRYPDGSEALREIVHHPGAAAIVAHDDLHVWLVRQPREAIGDADVLEIPAGKLDIPGESPLECAQRELAEEVGKTARQWAPIVTFAPSVGVMDELIHVYHATQLGEFPGGPQAQPGERIEVVAWPLDDLDGALAAARDSKTLIGLMWLRERLRR
ncbi:unannotated protein [freshwater metagenome]|uniref:Unannotated protein n=1 Tax=freshwater metagenome TaxID=449393 RepID=A0A6J7EN47_9ZZZZ|nr:NUDIX domain-containing protein [Actinomycetota bacterium]